MRYHLAKMVSCWCGNLVRLFEKQRGKAGNYRLVLIETHTDCEEKLWWFPGGGRFEKRKRFVDRAYKKQHRGVFLSVRLSSCRGVVSLLARPLASLLFFERILITCR